MAAPPGISSAQQARADAERRRRRGALGVPNFQTYFTSAADFPTRSAIVSELLEPPLVANGIALNSALGSAARIIGPGVGGLILAIWGSAACFALVAVTYIGATAALLMLRSAQFHPKRMARRTVVFKQLA